MPIGCQERHDLQSGGVVDLVAGNLDVYVKKHKHIVDFLSLHFEIADE